MSASSTIFYEDENYVIRPAKNTDEFRNKWWSFMQTLGWNRGYNDIDTYMNPSQGSGMILLIDKETDSPVGHIAAVINSNSTGWIAMFIVDELHRGKGMGRELFRAAEADFERCGTRVMGLDGVVEQKQTYERRRFQVSPMGPIKVMTRSLGQPDLRSAIPEGQLVNIRTIPHELLARHELMYTGFDRPNLWSGDHMFLRKDILGIALVTKPHLERVDDIHAWALARRCSGGFRIGPLYANNDESAGFVLHALMAQLTSDAVQSFPLPNEAMNEWSLEQIAKQATLVTEVWAGNSGAVELFENFGWEDSGIFYNRMWLSGNATPEQSLGGAAHRGVFAIFDAAVG